MGVEEMRVLHLLDNSNIGGIQEFIGRLYKASSHTHEFWAADGSMAPILRSWGMVLWSGAPPEWDYDIVMGHTVGGWSHDSIFGFLREKGIKTIEVMHSNATSPTSPSLVDMFISVNNIALGMNQKFQGGRRIYPFVDTASFKPNEHGNKIGRLSRLVREKRPHDFTEIARQFSGEQFIMAGDGDLREELERTKPDNLEMAGWVRDFPNFYNQLKLFVFPTQDECASCSVAYAQAAGVPIICQDIPQLRESTGGYARFATNRDDFIAQIREFLKDPAWYPFVGEARDWVDKNFNNINEWDNLVTEVKNGTNS